MLAVSVRDPQRFALLVRVGPRVECLAPSVTNVNGTVNEGVPVFEGTPFVGSSALGWGPGHPMSRPGIVE